MTTTKAGRARAQIVALSTAALGQGVPFFHGHPDILRSKSMDKNSFNSGDWFNRLFWDYSPTTASAPACRRAATTALATCTSSRCSPTLRPPTPAEIEWTAKRFRELLEIRGSSRLFRIGDAGDRRRLTFANGGLDAGRA